MIQNKLSFKSENLVVDYFEFKFDVLSFIYRSIWDIWRAFN
jgi:hypothetical protein